MATIAELLNTKKVILPSLQSFLNEIHSIYISTPQEHSSEISKNAPYRLVDDLSIFTVIVKYYGDGFHGKIPWSFWQTYKCVSGSTRSNRSLYHHWNGAMKKKYESFITSGRLSECIACLETAITADSYQLKHTSIPLMHKQTDTTFQFIKNTSYVRQEFQ